MRKYLSLLLIFLLAACFNTVSNDEIYKAQQIQTVYFEIVDNPSLINNYPANWNIYSEDVINRAKELYIQKSNKVTE